GRRVRSGRGGLGRGARGVESFVEGGEVEAALLAQPFPVAVGVRRRRRVLAQVGLTQLGLAGSRGRGWCWRGLGGTRGSDGFRVPVAGAGEPRVEEVAIG